MTTPLTPSTSIGMTINHGSIAHPIYGSAICSGTVPLLLPFGSFKYPAIKSDPSILDRMVTRSLPSYRGIWPDDLDSEIIAKLRDYITIGAYTVPTVDITSPAGEMLIGFTVLGFVIDDVMDDLSELAVPSFRNLRASFETLAGVFEGKYKSLEEMPNPVPALEPLLKFVWDFMAKSRPLLEKGDTKFILNRMKECIVGYVLLMEKGGDRFSQSSRDFFRAYVSGGSNAAEVAASVQGIVIPEELRENILFQRFKLCQGYVTFALNDAVGLRRDIEKDQVKDTSVLSDVVFHGMSLQKAWDKNFELLTGSMRDIKIAIGKIRELYEGDESVAKYLEVAEHCIDGQLYWYPEIGRYGSVGVNVVAV